MITSTSRGTCWCSDVELRQFVLFVYCPRYFDPLLFALWLSRLQYAIGRGLDVYSKRLAGLERYDSNEVTTKGYKVTTTLYKLI